MAQHYMGAHTQQRFKVTPWTIRNLSNGKYFVRGQSSYPGQNTGIEKSENDYPNHHILKILHSALLR
jgi:cephalosporin-C deacetylase-like acetyl esterase